MAKLKKYKIMAMTLPEALVAMIILLVIFGIIAVLFIKVDESTLSYQKIKAIEAAKLIASKLNEELKEEQTDTELEGFFINKKAVYYDKKFGLYRVDIEVKNYNGIKLAQKHLLIAK